jgi:O-antigen/teichoic acid export membrane protein
MLGFSVLLFFVRNTPSSGVRQVITFSVSLNMAGFALMGTFELLRGFVEPSILGAIVIEILVATIYFSFWVSDRRYVKKPMRAL